MATSARRIIVCVPNITQEASGPSYSVVRLCEALIAEGEAVTLVTLDSAPLASAPPFLRRFEHGWGPRRLGRSPAMHRWLMDAASEGDVRVIHNNSFWMMPNVYPGWVSRRTGVPLMISPRGTLSAWAMRSGSPVKRLFWPLLQRRVAEAARCFHATAEAEYEDIRRAGFRQPVAIIPNGIDIPEQLSRDPGRAGRTLLFLGRIHPIKGLDMLLPAWAKLQARFPDWRLRLVGPDARGHLAQMKELAARLGAERVEFAGELNGAAKWRAYAEADLFVLPSHSENFGVAVAEALASGTPAVVTRAAPWGGLVPNGAGWWIEAQTEALASCLESAMGTPAARLEAMGRAGRDWMVRDFSWRLVGRRMSETYGWIENGGPAPDWVRLD